MSDENPMKPCWLGGATGRGAEPSTESSAPSRCIPGTLGLLPNNWSSRSPLCLSQRFDEFPKLDGYLRPGTMFVISIRLPSGGSTASAMHPG